MIQYTSKIYRVFILLVLAPIAVLAQTATQNYTKTTIYREAGSGRPAIYISYYDGLGRPIQQRAYKMSGTGKDIVTHIEYDVAGRPAKNFLPFVSQSATLNYNPAAATDVMSFYGSPSPPQTGNPNFEATGNPYTEKLFEASPLGRILKQAAPGSSWKMPTTPADPDHTIRTEYHANSVADAVRLYKVTSSPYSGGYYPFTLSQQGTYPAGTLYKTVLKDENWTAGNSRTTQEFKNKQGRVLLKRTWGSSIVNNVPTEGWHDTYYVYDNFGNLAFVLPPLSDGSGSQADLEALCYQYRYDEHKRLVEKKLPGRQWEFIVYDSLDRVIATGPALSPFTDMAGATGWLFTKYDVFGRTTYTGWMQAAVNSTERNSLQAVQNVQTTNLNEIRSSSDNTVNGVAFRYTNTAWPTGTGWHVLSVSYYDDYAFPGASTTFSDVEGQPVYYNLTVKPKGLATGSWTRVPDVSTVVAGETFCILYDYNDRPIRSLLSNYLGGHTVIDQKLDFTGKVQYSITKQQRTDFDTEFSIREDFAYTDQDRPLSHTHKIGSLPAQLLAMNKYDELGQLVSKKVGGGDISGNSYYQKTDYAYNIRGWLKEINSIENFATDDAGSDLFAFAIRYDDVSQAYDNSLTPLYNGNISETRWMSRSDGKERSYSYTYDALNRLNKASYFKDRNYTKSYDEWMDYDRNGNILHMGRFGELDYESVSIQTDDLEYTYGDGNRLKKVKDYSLHPSGFRDGADTEEEYIYDTNGNMIADENKDITSITYNHLNLPVEITYQTGKKINYLYDASGRKLKKTLWDGNDSTATDYLSGFQYIHETLDLFPTAEGYVKYVRPLRGRPAQYNYAYNLKDHLGNIRMSYGMDNDKGGLVILEENHYYPFGLKHEKYNSDKYEYIEISKEDGGYMIGIEPLGPQQRRSYQYKYNGKELQDQMGLNLYDYGARNYDPAIGRWMNIDRMSEKYYPISPYVYTANNPIFFIDPDGNYIEIYYGKNSSEHVRYSYEKDRDYSEIEKISPFLADAYRALDALYVNSEICVDGEMVNIVKDIIGSTKELSVVHTDSGSAFAPARDFKSAGNWKDGVSSVIGTIHFNNKEGVLFDDTKDSNTGELDTQLTNKKFAKTVLINSPTSLLGHEFIHAFGWKNDAKGYLARRKDITDRKNTPYFRNAEEKRATTLSSQINTNLQENPRNNYMGVGVPTQGVLSNKLKL